MEIDYKTMIDQKDKEILKYLFQGKTAKEIGKLVFMSSRTVEGRLMKIRFHYDCRNNVQLAAKLSESTENSVTK